MSIESKEPKQSQLTAKKTNVPSTLSLFFGNIATFFSEPCDMHQAICDNDLDSVNRLAQKFLEIPYLDCTPLAIAYLKQKHEIVLSLLVDHQANANAFMKLSSFPKTTIMEEIIERVDVRNHEEAVGDMKLFILYGGIPLQKKRIKPETTRLIARMLEYQQTRKKCENILSAPTIGDTHQANLELAELYSKLLTAEKVPIYADHYRKKADVYKVASNVVELPINDDPGNIEGSESNPLLAEGIRQRRL
jgi:hypothetical protein